MVSSQPSSKQVKGFRVPAIVTFSHAVSFFSRYRSSLYRSCQRVDKFSTKKRVYTKREGALRTLETKNVKKKKKNAAAENWKSNGKMLWIHERDDSRYVPTTFDVESCERQETGERHSAYVEAGQHRIPLARGGTSLLLLLRTRLTGVTNDRRTRSLGRISRSTACCSAAAVCCRLSSKCYYAYRSWRNFHFRAA